MYYVYIIYSESKDRYYIGFTGGDPQWRLQRHNMGWTRSTKSGIPWKLMHFESFETKTEALKRENFIKRQKSRKFLEKLINGE